MPQFTIQLPKSFLSKNEGSELLLHQEATLEALRQGGVVVNDTQTGSGKTRGALLYLKDLIESIPDQYFAILYVAPVNSLISEKVKDIHDFLKRNDLDYHLFPITSYTMQKIKEACRENKYFVGKGYSNGELLTHFFKNPISIVPYMDIALQSILNVRDVIDYRTKPFVYLINPDILYYAMFGEFYDKHMQNINLELLENFRYVIFDEFHYYTYFQLSSFFALLSYWKMMKYFESSDPAKKVNVCLLSATPNRFIYETIEDKLNIQFTVVNDRDLAKPKDFELLEFLSTVNLTVTKISAKTSFKDAVLSFKRSISNYIKAGKYGLIVCNSIKTANELFAFFSLEHRDKFARITGTITEQDRKIAINSQVIIATNTVDIGFNFKRKQNVDRQNIDFIFIDHYNYDDFVQRLGRGGRILGKSITDEETDAFLFLHDRDFYACEALIGLIDVSKSSRFELLENIKDVFPEREHFFNFFKIYGNFVANSFVEMFREITLAQKGSIIDNVLVSWKKLLGTVYCVENDEKRLNRLTYLHSIASKGTKISEKDKRSLAYFWLNDGNYRRSNGGLNGIEILHSKLSKVPLEEALNHIRNYSIQILSDNDWTIAKTFYNNFESQLQNYLEFQRIYFKALKNNFRSSSDIDITVSVYDPNSILGSKRTKYSFYHIMQYYNFEIEVDQPKYSKVKIVSLLDKFRYFYFQLDLRDLRDIINRDNFEKGIGELKKGQFLWRFIHFKKGRTGSLQLKFEDVSPELPLALKRNLEKDLIIYIVPFNFAYLRNNNLLRLSPRKLKVLFSGNNSETYAVFFGKNALIAYSIVINKRG